jgi:hypothetical protein
VNSVSDARAFIPIGKIFDLEVSFKTSAAKSEAKSQNQALFKQFGSIERNRGGGSF